MRGIQKGRAIVAVGPPRCSHRAQRRDASATLSIFISPTSNHTPRIVLGVLFLAFIDYLGKNVGYYLDCQWVWLACSRFVLICQEPTVTGDDPTRCPRVK